MIEFTLSNRLLRKFTERNKGAVKMRLLLVAGMGHDPMTSGL